ncbi:hypothetical protein AO373_1470 [Moraxella catarrhalis]|nr:hypothetical protein AO379_0986 [Moraxella catarrhalis]OAV17660.1 hypothetical protein AO373_1470 [Moraxella catarrhalis]
MIKRRHTPKAYSSKKHPINLDAFFGYKFWIQVIDCVHIND